jgi:hypothetical protein
LLGNDPTTSTSESTTGAANPTAAQSALPQGQGHPLQIVLAVLACLLLAGAVVLPPLLHQRLSNRRAT